MNSATLAWPSELQQRAALEDVLGRHRSWPGIDLAEEAQTGILELDTWTFVSALHVERIVAELTPGARVLSIGGGPKLWTDRLLASRYPMLEFEGTDLRADCRRLRLPGNLSWRRLDICQAVGHADFDLVYSVECFEHIRPDWVWLAVLNATSFVRPGGSLLLIVPFANQREQQDPALIAKERAFGHTVAGYDAAALTRLIGMQRFGRIRFENCYWLDTLFLRRYLHAAWPAVGSRLVGPLLELARLDIRPDILARDRTEALGIKVLATGKASATC